MGKALFKPKTHESTSTICKVRNSTKIIIVTESISGGISVKDLTNTCDPNTGAGVTFLRNELEHLTDKSELGERSRYRSVDVGFPISILKVSLYLYFIHAYSKNHYPYELQSINKMFLTGQHNFCGHPRDRRIIRSNPAIDGLPS